MSANFRRASSLEAAIAANKLSAAFSEVSNEVHIGQLNPECASCRKPFSVVRKRRKEVRLYPSNTPVALAFSFDICGRCWALYQKGGAAADGVLAAVEAYCDGEEASQ